MLNEIIEGMTRNLHDTFGDGYNIERDGGEQGINRPCFFLAVLKLERKSMIGRRFLLRNAFDVQYYPTVPGKNGEIFTVADQLLEALTFITLPNGDLLHGTGMTYEVTDGTLHFFVQYNLPVLHLGEKTKMEILQVEVEAAEKGGLHGSKKN